MGVIDITQKLQDKKDEELVWSCECGSTNFYITPVGIECRDSTCGKKTSWKELFAQEGF
jgi:hypothetical protein